MSLQISTGDVMVEMGPFIATGDGVVDKSAVDLYCGRCGRDRGDRSLLEREWWGMVL